MIKLKNCPPRPLKERARQKLFFGSNSYSVKLRSSADTELARRRTGKMRHNANIVDYLSAMKKKLIKIRW